MKIDVLLTVHAMITQEMDTILNGVLSQMVNILLKSKMEIYENALWINGRS
jgi:hypothetical protein